MWLNGLREGTRKIERLQKIAEEVEWTPIAWKSHVTSVMTLKELANTSDFRNKKLIAYEEFTNEKFPTVVPGPKQKMSALFLFLGP